MKLELLELHLSTLIDVLNDTLKKYGDLKVGFEDETTYTNRVKLKTTGGDIIFDLTR